MNFTRNSLPVWKYGLILALAVVSPGCGGSNRMVPAKLANVVGKVILDDQPLSGCSVSFIPRDQTKGQGGFAVTNADGAYSAKHWSNVDGIEPGTYTVVFSKIAQPDGSPIPEGKNAADVNAKEMLPRKLTDPNVVNGVNVVTVLETGAELDFKLKSK